MLVARRGLQAERDLRVESERRPLLEIQRQLPAQPPGRRRARAFAQGLGFGCFPPCLPVERLPALRPLLVPPELALAARLGRWLAALEDYRRVVVAGPERLRQS